MIAYIESQSCLDAGDLLVYKQLAVAWCVEEARIMNKFKFYAFAIMSICITIRADQQNSRDFVGKRAS